MLTLWKHYDDLFSLGLAYSTFSPLTQRISPLCPVSLFHLSTLPNIDQSLERRIVKQYHVRH